MLYQIYVCVSEDSPGIIIFQLKYLNIEQVDPQIRGDIVKIIGTLIYLISGYYVRPSEFHFPRNLQFRKDLNRYIKYINSKALEGKIHHIPMKLHKCGLNDIPLFTKMIKNWEINGYKLVISLQYEKKRRKKKKTNMKPGFPTPQT